MTTISNFNFKCRGFEHDRIWRKGNWRDAAWLSVAAVLVVFALRGLDVYASPSLDIDEVKVVGEQHTPTLPERYDVIPVPCQDNKSRWAKKPCEDER